MSQRVSGQSAEWASEGSAELRAEPSLVHVLGIDYVHSTTDDGGDLYLTSYGVQLAPQLSPANWLEPSWFRDHRERLDGSGSVHAVPTNPLAGESIALVVKYSRVGERVPINTEEIENVLACDFNGPFEEFALLEDLRTNRRGPSNLRIKTQLPLAIYVCPARSEPWQLQRFRWRIARKSALHPGITIDIRRQYIMVFGWLPGIDAWDAHGMGLLSEDDIRQLCQRAKAALKAKGFRILDLNPRHLIVQMNGPGQLLRRHDEIDWGIVDYELLERTADYYQEICALRRKTYERRRGLAVEQQSHGNHTSVSSASWPAGLRPVTVFGVDYVHGRAESTGGMLWVVGRDPDLFDYCLPERWRTALQQRFIKSHDTFFTTSKNNVDFVWKVSRVGERPEMAAFGAEGFKAFAFGFNSPFEEVSLAHRLRQQGFPAITPLAVYRTRNPRSIAESLFDLSRYRSHAHLLACDGSSILETRCSYITIWDPWQRLEALGVEVVRLMPTQILVEVNTDEEVLRNDRGALEACLCGFQHLSWAVE